MKQSSLTQEQEAAMTATMPKILPLENGDFLTRAEFERRYEAMPHLKKAELIICCFISGRIGNN